ncbi:MAG: TonB-dependent receptor [Bacteroides sp.]
MHDLKPRLRFRASCLCRGVVVVGLLLTLWIVPHALWAQRTSKKHTLRGFVRETTSQETLPGAQVVWVGTTTGTATNNYGYYSLILPAGEVKLRFSYVGYQAKEITLRVERDSVLDIGLEPEEIEQVVIEGKALNESSRSSRMGALQISKRALVEVPMLLGERDVMRVVQLLPGVNKGREGTSGLYVRGGGIDQNLILLDDAPVYNAYHLMGMFSLFSGNAVKNIELVKGGFPARYGGRLASVLDIVMEDGNMQRYKGSVSLGLISSQASVQGPIVKNKASFLVTGRRTYTDILLSPLMRDLEVSPVFYFYDLTAKLNVQLDSRNRLFASGYFGADRFGAESLKTQSTKMDVGITWGNRTGSFRWNHLWRENAFSNLTLIYSSYDLLTYMNLKIRTNEYSQTFSSGIENLGVKYDVNWTQWENHAIRFGGQAIGYRFMPMASTLKYSERKINETERTVLHSIEAAVYAEDDLRVGDLGRLNLGLRGAYYGIDQTNHFFLEPRASGSLYVTDQFSLKAGYALMNQNLHLLSSTGVGLPTDLWIPATKRLRPQRSWIASLGGVYDIEPIQSSLSVEGYYRESKGNITYREGASYLGVDDLVGHAGRYWEDMVTRGTSWSTGVEFLLQRRVGNLTGWVGYTLSWTRVQFPDMNLGRSYWATYDRRHDISVVAMYRFNDHWRAAATWVYGTGNAFTLPRALIAVPDDPQTPGSRLNAKYIDYGEINGSRMGANHRLDIGIQWVKKLKYAERIVSFDLYNTYNRRNPFFYLASPEGETTLVPSRHGFTRTTYVLKKFTLFPLLPSVSITFNF